MVLKWLRQKRARFSMLSSYLFLHVTHLQQSLSRFTRNTLIEAAIFKSGSYKCLSVHSKKYVLTSTMATVCGVFVHTLSMVFKDTHSVFV